MKNRPFLPLSFVTHESNRKKKQKDMQEGFLWALITIHIRLTKRRHATPAAAGDTAAAAPAPGCGGLCEPTAALAPRTCPQNRGCSTDPSARQQHHTWGLLPALFAFFQVGFYTNSAQVKDRLLRCHSSVLMLKMFQEVTHT